MTSHISFARCVVVAVLVLMLCVIGSAAAQQSAASVKQIQAKIAREPNNPDLYVALGLAYWDKNDSAHALSAFQHAVKVGPRSAEAHNWLGVALSEKADLPGAIAAFRKAVALNPRYGRAYTNLGAALAKSGDLAEAVDVFQKALALEPNNLAAHLNLGMALREKGDLEAALAHLRPVAAADPNNAGIQYELGQTLRQSGDLAGAIAAFERSIAINPELREGYYGLGLALKQQSAASAAAVSKASIATAVSPADEAYTRAEKTAADGNLNGAREQLTEALRLDDHHAQAHNLLGFVLGQQGDPAAALTHLQRAVALRPEFADAHYNLGVALWYSGSKEKAIAELRESVRLDPAAGPAHAFLGVALRDSGDLAGSRVSLQRAIALLPPTAAVYIDLGITYLRAGDLDRSLGQFEAGLNLNAPASSGPTPDWDAAIAALRQTLSANPKQAEAHNVLGLLLGRKGATSNEVAAEFREAIKLRPDYAEAHNNLGLVLIQSGDDDGGIAALREAVRVSPDYADAHANLGAALTPTDAEAAIRELEKAVALAPTSVKAQFNLAIAYGAVTTGGAAGGVGTAGSAGAAKQSAAREIEQLRKVIALAPTFARAHLALGKALMQDGNVQDAVASLREAARLEPNSGEAHYQLGLALSRAGQREEAAAELRKGRELVAADDRQQNVALDIAEGRDAASRGDLDAAAEKYRHAIKLQPDSTEAQRALDEVLKQSKQQQANQRPAKQVDDPARVTELEGYFRERKFKEVEPLLADYVRQHATSTWGWYALGYSQFAQQKIGESIKSLAKSLELDVHNAEAHKILGRNLMIIGRFDAAQLEFEQGLRDKPDSAELQYNLGKLFSIQDNWDAAKKAFEAALRIDASYVEAVDALGFALEALGDDTGAIAKYQQAIALNEERKGSFAGAHVNLSAYYNRIGDPDKALTYARQAIALDPKSDRAWFQRAKADERQGRLADAVAALNTAISYNSHASSYYYVLANVYRRLGNKEDSKAALDMFQKLDRESTELDKKRRAARAEVMPPGQDRD